MRKSEKFAHFTLDLRSKYIDVVGITSGGIHLMANKASLKLRAGSKRDDVTWVEFVGYEDWSVIGVTSGRYTVDAVLTAPLTTQEYEEASENSQWLPELEYEGETHEIR